MQCHIATVPAAPPGWPGRPSRTTGTTRPAPKTLEDLAFTVGLYGPGRRHHSPDGPVTWITDWTQTSAGLKWARLSEEAGETGLRPFLLADMAGAPGRPWGIPGRDGDEVVSTPLETADITAVLRSWEDRFGARLLEVGFAAVRLLVTRPSRTLAAALPIAAEQAAFSDEARSGLRSVDEIARAIVDNPFWDFWWD